MLLKMKMRMVVNVMHRCCLFRKVAQSVAERLPRTVREVIVLSSGLIYAVEDEDGRACNAHLRQHGMQGLHTPM